MAPAHITPERCLAKSFLSFGSLSSILRSNQDLHGAVSIQKVSSRVFKLRELDRPRQCRSSWSVACLCSVMSSTSMQWLGLQGLVDYCSTHVAAVNAAKLTQL